MNTTTKQCPQCHTENPIEANFCRHCRHEFSESSKSGKSIKPIISSLSIQESNYCEGSLIHVIWSVDNITNLSLNGQDVTGLNGVELIVDKNRVIKLVAENDYSVASKEILLEPKPLAKILYLRCDKDSLLEGQKVKLMWSVRDAQRVILRDEEGDIDVTNKTDYIISPSKTSQYTLMAISSDECFSDEESVTVTIVKEINILSFDADKTRIAETMPVTLSWKVENADKLELLPHYQDVTGRDGITLYPKSNIEYKLVASNSISTKEAYVSVGVQSLPKIDMKSFDGLCSVKIPNISIDMSQVTRPIDEVAIENWMETPDVDSLKLKIGEVNIFSKLKKLLSRSFK